MEKHGNRTTLVKWNEIVSTTASIKPEPVWPNHWSLTGPAVPI